MQSPPLTPINTHHADTNSHSPTLSYRSHNRRRTSSFSSRHEISPITSRHRLSNASRYSRELRTPVEAGEDPFGGDSATGMGNLADELDQLDDEDEDYDEAGDVLGSSTNMAQEVIRDSGIDVSFMEKQAVPHMASKRREETVLEDQLPPGLCDAMDDIAKLCTASHDRDLVVKIFLKTIQDLGNQTAIESGVQRFNTSINSMGTHMQRETKALQTLSTSFLPPYGLFMLDMDAVEGTLPLIEELISQLPLPDPEPSQHLEKLTQETNNVVLTLSTLLDTLQLGKQISNTAARHLRTTQNMLAEYQKEQSRADEARATLSKSDAEKNIQSRWASQQCHDIVSGFSGVCDSLHRDLSEALQIEAIFLRASRVTSVADASSIRLVRRGPSQTFARCKHLRREEKTAQFTIYPAAISEYIIVVYTRSIIVSCHRSSFHNLCDSERRNNLQPSISTALSQTHSQASLHLSLLDPASEESDSRACSRRYNSQSSNFTAFSA